jgi:MFS family permease
MSISDLVLILLGLGVVLAMGHAARYYWQELKDAPRPFWLILLFCCAGITAMKATQLSLMLWLCRDCALSDVQASWASAAYSLLCLLIGLKLGSFCSRVGLRRAILVSSLSMAFAAAFLSCVTHPVLILFAGFPPLALGFGIVRIISQLGIKSFVPTAKMPVAFALLCVLYNLSAALGGWLFDQARVAFASRDAAGLIVNEAAGSTLLGLHFSSYQLIFLVSLPVALAGWLLASAIPSEPTSQEQAPKEESSIGPGFGVLLGVLTSMVFVDALFMHCEQTLPVYNLRIFGDGVKTGGLSCVLNCLLMVILVPVVSRATRKISSWTMVIVGTFTCASSFFFFLIPPEFWLPLHQTWLGDWLLIKWLAVAPDTASLGLKQASYWGCILMVFVLTLGETLWAPRLPQLCLELAPRGKEAQYLSLITLPVYAARVLVCSHSGALLQHYTGGHSHPESLWLWVACLGLVAPLGLSLSWLKHQASQKQQTQTTETQGLTP